MIPQIMWIVEEMFLTSDLKQKIKQKTNKQKIKLP